MTKVARQVFLISVLLLNGFFCGQIPIVRAEANAIIINEIAAFEAGDHEWIEIYNRGDIPVDLTGWKFFEDNTNHSLKIWQGGDLIIEAGEYAIIADVAENFIKDYPDFKGTIIDSSWTTLNEAGESLGLKDASGNLVETLTYLPAENYSLERIDFNLDDYSVNNWKEHPTGATPGQLNYWREHINDPIIVDTIPPEEITNLIVKELDQQIQLSWNLSINSAGDLASENLYVNNGAKIILDKNISSYLAANLDNGAVYTFKITVVDLTGNESVGATITATPHPEVVVPETILSPGDIVINEFVSDPIAGYDEWIELYNKTDQEIDLSKLIITEGSGAINNLIGKIEPRGFFVLADPKGSLNNSGDIVVLKDSTEQIIDQVAYGDWDDGNKADNAPAVADPNAVARRVDGGDFNNDQNDFSKTYTPTKGLPNQITAEPTSGSSKTVIAPPTNVNNNTTNASLYKSRDIVVNEFVSDPADNETEFIELYNNTANQISLVDFIIIDGSGAETKLTGSIGGNGSSRFYVVENPKGSLNNAGDKIILKYKEVIIDEVSFGNWNDGKISDNAPVASDPYSVARKVDGADSDIDKDDFVATKTVSKGAPNIISVVVVEEKKSDPSATVKPSNSCLGIIINEILPNPVGSDVENEFIELKNISDKKIDLAGCKLGDSSSKRYIISIKDLTSTEILPDGFLVVYRKISGIALDNSGEEEAGFYDSEDKAISLISYAGEIKEGESFSLIDKTYEWTDIATPGAENKARIISPLIDYGRIISISEFLPNPENGDEWIELKNNSSDQVDLSGLLLDDGDGGSRPFSLKGLSINANDFIVLPRERTKLVLNNDEDSVRLLNLDGEVVAEVFYEETFKGLSYARDKNNRWQWTTKITLDAENQIILPAEDSATDKKNSQSFVNTTLEEIDNLEIGDKVRVQGKVAVLPGVFTSQTIYLSGSPGIQVYFYKKNWPKLNLGDVIAVSGEISESNGERRIKISSQDNIVLTGQKEELTPMAVNAELTAELVGDLVIVEGQILEIKGKNFYLENNGAEITVYVKDSTGIDTANLTVGEPARVVGIVSPSKDGYRIMPRMPADITFTGQVLGAETVNTNQPFLTGWKKYLLATVVGLMIGGWWWRRRNKERVNDRAC